ncbi:E3 ubiquitin-protein ligase hel2 [Smittium mucronatum]|uniref:RING-type E3 ubiquitin transferase n=1 Tax=Smittium mucronatum TaxID=133383 RepID=A0A1R0GN44_9FUNG|nr:E3 ubiquitin-protein ligase hel2 [Smittium mucronatum]
MDKRNRNSGASILERRKTKDKNNEDYQDKNICFICAGKKTQWAIGSCNHPCCSLCSLRLRALYKNNSCPYCKIDLKDILFVSSPIKEYSSYKNMDEAYYDKDLGFHCENQKIYDYSLSVLSFACPMRSCDYVDDTGYQSLKVHLFNEHGRVFCDICLENKKVFSFEQDVFYPNSLSKHYKHGNSKDFNGHPECKFCSIYFYDSDALYSHCKKSHEQCFLCQNVPSRRYDYYKDYHSLVDHFNNDHFPCRYPSCIERKFVVFGSEIDLKAHEFDVHGKNLSGQRAKWEAKKIPIQVTVQPFSRSRRDQNSSSDNNDQRNRQSSSQKSRKSEVSSSPSSSHKNYPTTSSSSNISGHQNPEPSSTDTIISPKTSDSNKIEKKDRPSKSSALTTQNASTSSKKSPSISKESEDQSKRYIPGLHTEESNRPAGPVLEKPVGFGKLSNENKTTKSEVPSNSTIESHNDLHQMVLNLLKSTQKVEEFRKLTKELKHRKITPSQYVGDLSENLFKNYLDLVNVVKSVSNLIDDKDLTFALQSAKKQFPALQSLDIGSSTTSAGKSVRIINGKGPAKSWNSAAQTSLDSKSFPSLSSVVSSSRPSSALSNSSNVSSSKVPKKPQQQSYGAIAKENPNNGNPPGINGKGGNTLANKTKRVVVKNDEQFPSLQPSSSHSSLATKGSTSNSSKKNQTGKKAITLRLV